MFHSLGLQREPSEVHGGWPEKPLRQGVSKQETLSWNLFSRAHLTTTAAFLLKSLMKFQCVMLILSCKPAKQHQSNVTIN